MFCVSLEIRRRSSVVVKDNERAKGVGFQRVHLV